MQLSMDTKSAFGLLTCKRTVNIEDPAYEVITTNYNTYKTEGNLKEAEKCKGELLAKWFKRHIKPGEQKYATAAADKKVTAAVRWYAESDHIRVWADVTDPYYDTDAPREKPAQASCVEILICPSGIAEEVNLFYVVPAGENGVPWIKQVKSDVPGFTATWKRTGKGYRVEASIPYASLNGYKPGWKVMPVELLVDSKGDGKKIRLAVNGSKQPMKSTKSYLGLLPK